MSSYGDNDCQGTILATIGELGPPVSVYVSTLKIEDFLNGQHAWGFRICKCAKN